MVMTGTNVRHSAQCDLERGTMTMTDDGFAEAIRTLTADQQELLMAQMLELLEQQRTAA